jgi:hypothetical protein
MRRSIIVVCLAGLLLAGCGVFDGSYNAAKRAQAYAEADAARSAAFAAAAAAEAHAEVAQAQAGADKVAQAEASVRLLGFLATLAAIANAPTVTAIVAMFLAAIVVTALALVVLTAPERD